SQGSAWCRTLLPDGLPEWTILVIRRLSLAVGVENRLRSLGQESADFPPLALHARDAHVVVGGGLVAHPGDDGRLGPLGERDALRAGDRAAADRRGVGRHQVGESS